MDTKLKMLDKIIDKVGKRMRPEILIGIEDGVKKVYKNFKNKGINPTIELVVTEITKDKNFISVIGKVDVTVDDITDIAVRVFKDKEDMDKEHDKEKELKVGRNDKCPCGSGKKYKKCCSI
jgi:preprotein translocase subunit SecA